MRDFLSLDNLKQEDPLFAQVFDFIAKKSPPKVYLVGGYLRDKILGQTPLDIDLLLKDDVFDFGRQLADVLKGSFFVLDETFQVARIVIKKKSRSRTIDVAALKDSIDTDLMNRDFTINALALDIRRFFSTKTLSFPGDLIDVSGGWDDLRQKSIRLVNKEGFLNDPVRLIRAVRLSQELGFKIETLTYKLIKQEAAYLQESSPERLTGELLAIFDQPEVRKGIALTDNLMLLKQIIPELEELKGMIQNAHHHLDVWKHTLLTLKNLEKILLDLSYYFPGNEEAIMKHLGQPVFGDFTRRTFLFLSGLLHDVGKKETKSVDKRSGIHFYGHPKVGAEKTIRIMSRLRLSKKARSIVASVVLNHMRPGYLAATTVLTKRACNRFLEDAGEEAVETALLSLADGLAARGPLSTRASRTKLLEVNRTLIDHFFKREKEPLVPLLTGHELMAAFGLDSSPLIGQLLQYLRRLQQEGTIHKRSEAIDEIAKTLSNMKL